MERAILALLLCTWEIAQGQLTWEKTLNSGAYYVAKSVDTATAGWIMSASGIGPGDDLLLTALSPAGVPQWARSYALGDSTTTLEAGGAIQTANGGYLLCAYYETANLFNPKAGTVLVRTDNNGDTLWVKRYATGFCVPGECKRQVREVPGGGFVVAAGGDTSAFAQSKVVVLRLDANGDTLWTRMLSGPLAQGALSVEVVPSGGFIIGGYTEGFGAGQGDMYLAKLDAAGNLAWAKTYGGVLHESCASVRPTPDGGFILTGHSRTFSAGETDVYLVKTDSAGNLQWSRSYGDSMKDFGLEVYPASDGGYLVFACQQSPVNNQGDVLLIKTDAIGDTLWTKIMGGPGNEEAYAGCLRGDGWFLSGGLTTSFPINQGRIYLIHDHLNNPTIGCNPVQGNVFVTNPATITGSGGTVGAGLALADTVEAMGIVNFTDSLMCLKNLYVPEDDASVSIFSMHPNPTTGVVTISNTQQGIMNVEVFDLLGKPAPYHFDIQRSTLDIRSCPPGMYFVRLAPSPCSAPCRRWAGGAVSKLIKQ